MIETFDLSRRYGERLAVDRVRFTAKPGEVVGLLGPNGAGKTTTMRMLTGFLPPTSGTAKIAGHDIVEDSMEARRLVGYLPERVPIYPDMTAHGYVEFWAQLRGVRAAKQAAEAALERVGLASRRRTLVRNLSKGMRQRLGLAQALVHDPPVIILDEPTIGIDPQQVIEVRENVRALGRDHTVLFSTHILSEAEQVCDRVLIINNGQIVAQGKPAELRELRKGERLRITLSGANPKEATALLKSVSGVTQVQRDRDDYLVTVAAGQDARGDLSNAIVKAGYRLLEIRAEMSSLEAAFLDIVTGEQVGGKTRS